MVQVCIAPNQWIRSGSVDQVHICTANATFLPGLICPFCSHRLLSALFYPFLPSPCPAQLSSYLLCRAYSAILECTGKLWPTHQWAWRLHCCNKLYGTPELEEDRTRPLHISTISWDFFLSHGCYKVSFNKEICSLLKSCNEAL